MDWRVLILVSLCVSALSQNCQDPKCVSCSDPAVCDLCNYEHYPKNGVCTPCNFSLCLRCTETACTECHSGYFMNSTSLQCESCFQKLNCLTCNFDGVCRQCNNYFYLNNGVCTACPPHCSYCDAQTCSGCEIRYFLENGKCQSCGKNCNFCASQINCTSCTAGYYPNAPNGGLCLQCPDENCQFCYSNSTCYDCINGFYLNINSCHSCLPYNCLDCYDPDYCIYCVPGYRLLQNRTCEKCAVNQCSSCLRGYCSECFGGHYLDLSASPTCKQCKQLNCSVCYSNATCTQCLSGFQLTSNGICASCKTNNCDACPKQICTDCIDSFFLDSVFECQPCITPLCKICTASTCTSCLSGYFLIDGECVSCPFSNCKLCDPSLAFCLICDDNYFYDNLGCKSCLDINCSKCNSKGECTACPVNTILVGLSCIACPISHCFTCATVNVCLNCVEGYHWSTGNSACEKLIEETPWWFWTVVGVAGVVIVLGTALFILRWWNTRKLEQYSRRVEFSEDTGAVSGQNYVELKSKK